MCARVGLVKFIDMRRIICFLYLVVASWTYPLHNPFQYAFPLAYQHPSAYSDTNYGYSYAPRLQSYSHTNDYFPDFAGYGYSALPQVQPTLNVLAELPYAVSNEFSVVPMFVVSKNTVNTISQGKITSISAKRPMMTIKLGSDESIQCTPAVRMVLEKPLLVGSLKSDVLFPTEIQIVHEGVRMPIKIGAVIAPVLPQTYVSQETPIAVKVVYAIPTAPLKITITIEQNPALQTPTPQPGAPALDQRFPEPSNLNSEDKKHQPVASALIEEKPSSIPPAAEEILQNQTMTGSGNNQSFGALSDKPNYVNDVDAVVVPNQEAVVVESESDLPPKNITVIDFPQQEAEPHLEVDEEDEELVNRNPPLVLAPAGIVQSTQPVSHVEPFHNDKESPYLETLREQAKKKLI